MSMLSSSWAFLAANWLLIVVPAGVIMLVALSWDLLNEDDPRQAARKSTGRMFGLGTGILSVVGAVLVEGMHVVAEFPGLVMGAIGLGGIIAGIHWGAVGAIMLMSYIVMMAVRGD